jgi:glycerophosphoryl diester phosphodiesterase
MATGSVTEYGRGVTAHRGASGERPENTLAAFAAAVQLGVDWLECDAHLTADGHVVVIHDGRTGRTGDVDLAVAETSLAELQAVDAAAQFRERRGLSVEQCGKHTIPLLSEVLELVMQTSDDVRLSVQPKADCVAQIWAVVCATGIDQHRIGFNDSSLEYMSQARQLAPAATIFWDRVWGHPAGPPLASNQLEEDLAIATEQGFNCLVLHKGGCSAEAVATIHRAGEPAAVSSRVIIMCTALLSCLDDAPDSGDTLAE